MSVAPGQWVRPDRNFPRSTLAPHVFRPFRIIHRPKEGDHLRSSQPETQGRRKPGGGNTVDPTSSTRHQRDSTNRSQQRRHKGALRVTGKRDGGCTQRSGDHKPGRRPPRYAQERRHQPGRPCQSVGKGESGPCHDAASQSIAAAGNQRRHSGRSDEPPKQPRPLKRNQHLEDHRGLQAFLHRYQTG